MIRFIPKPRLPLAWSATSLMDCYDQAMIWLNKAYEARFNPSILLRAAFDPLRSDARFQDLRRQLGLLR